VDNIDQHPYHHHVQPYQIVALGNDSNAMNAWWRVRSSPLSMQWAVVGGTLEKLLLPAPTALSTGLLIMRWCATCNHTHTDHFWHVQGATI
jgi:hypothetical protein